MARYRIDPERSRIWIDATSSLHPIHSESSGVEGTLEAEMSARANVKHAQIELPVRLLTSGNALYDREMMRRIDARRYPKITGLLTAMKPSGTDGRYVVTGDVTFRGVTKSFEDELTLSAPDDKTLRLEGQHVFDIRDFGMDPPRILTLRVHPEVSVRIAIIATRDE
jgi:polyisoprenoid-binding protein YceI